MTLGITAIDKQLSKYGLANGACDNPFQKVDLCFGGEQPDISGFKIPFCIAKAIFQTPMYTRLYLHRFVAPKADKPFACCLMTENGDVIERVYYENSRRYYQCSDRLLILLTSLWLSGRSKAA
ncbi:hypothetical protein [Alteromonas oceanisediminis]|uniref:hypothetical protein n=1 Tax=Alteromonas oceanisediminis TaxID=2836180 RepID=UPI001BDB6601|nr:hypothetical protein [Alteromonas oceanisediminis]MBT0587360.1 hypothetical protein [Alteromonas oceanisediminis]